MQYGAVQTFVQLQNAWNFLVSVNSYHIFICVIIRTTTVEWQGATQCHMWAIWATCDNTIKLFSSFIMTFSFLFLLTLEHCTCTMPYSSVRCWSSIFQFRANHFCIMAHTHTCNLKPERRSKLYPVPHRNSHITYGYVFICIHKHTHSSNKYGNKTLNFANCER